MFYIGKPKPIWVSGFIFFNIPALAAPLVPTMPMLSLNYGQVAILTVISVLNFELKYSARRLRGMQRNKSLYGRLIPNKRLRLVGLLVTNKRGHIQVGIIRATADNTGTAIKVIS